MSDSTSPDRPESPDLPDRPDAPNPPDAPVSPETTDLPDVPDLPDPLAELASYVDHIGIAVEDLDAGLALYRDLLGLKLEAIEIVPSENIRVALLRFGGGAIGHLELLAPLGEHGAVAAYIERYGPGLHHIAVAVPDIEAALERCRVAGLTLLDNKPRPGAAGKMVAFLHPRSGNGVLIEMCTRPVPV